MRVRNLVPSRQYVGDPASIFYGDPVEITPSDAADAIGHEADTVDVPATAIASSTADESEAARRVAAYESMTPQDKAQVTNVPPLATWNAFTVINPMLGNISSNSLNYLLLKALNDYAFQGATVMGEVMSGNTGHRVTIDYAALWGSDTATHFAAVPFIRFAISASQLNARPGAQIKLTFEGVDAQGTSINTRALGYTHAFQRLGSTEAIIGVFIPNAVVATRSLPFLPIVGKNSDDTGVKQLIITFEGTSPDEQVSVTIPGYATAELREISQMYSLPAGMIR